MNLFLSLLLFFILHISIWRISFPKYGNVILILLGAACSFLLKTEQVYYWGFILAYLCLYSGVDQQSVSMKMVRLIYKSNGISREDLYEKLPHDIVFNRTKSMQSVWLNEDEINSRGRIIIFIFRVFQKSFNLPRGG